MSRLRPRPVRGSDIGSLTSRRAPRLGLSALPYLYGMYDKNLSYLYVMYDNFVYDLYVLYDNLGPKKRSEIAPKPLWLTWIRISRLKSISCEEFLANPLILKRHEHRNERTKHPKPKAICFRSAFPTTKSATSR